MLLWLVMLLRLPVRLRRLMLVRWELLLLGIDVEGLAEMGVRAERMSGDLRC